MTIFHILGEQCETVARRGDATGERAARWIVRARDVSRRAGGVVGGAWLDRRMLREPLRALCERDRMALHCT